MEPGTPVEIKVCRCATCSRSRQHVEDPRDQYLGIVMPGDLGGGSSWVRFDQSFISDLKAGYKSGLSRLKRNDDGTADAVFAHTHLIAAPFHTCPSCERVYADEDMADYLCNSCRYG
jgi:hypothetical protein